MSAKWLLVTHRSEVSKRGDYVRLPHPMGDIVAYNDEGEVRVIDGLCPHRGTQIFPDYPLHGNKTATCPYHGWTFRHGSMHIPNAQAYPVLGPKAQMVTYHHAWVGDWLFASRHSPAEAPIEDELGGLLQFLSDTSNTIDRRVGMEVATIEAHRDVCIENALEDYHINTIHKTTFASMRLKRLMQHRIGDSSMATYEIENRRTVRMINALGRHLQYSTGAGYFHLFLAPCAALSGVGGLSFSVQHYLPLDGDRCLFITRLYAVKMKPGAPDMTQFYKDALAFNLKVFHEDAQICERVRGRGHALASPDEDRIRWFRESTC